MKKALFLIAIVFAFTSCRKDSPRKVTKMFEDGTWRITYYNDKGTDKTATYTGDVFTFNDDNTVVGTHSSTTFSGTWDCDRASGRHTLVVLDFKNPSEFMDISKSWTVIEKTDTSLKLDFTESDGKKDYLTFEKN